MLEPVKDFPDYAVDSNGDVWSLKNNKWGLRKEYFKLKPWTGTDGYSRVTLYQINRKVKRPVHQLILEAFVGKCPVGMEARHGDGNKENNRADNLEWGTPKENQADRLKHGTDARGEKHKNSKLISSQVKEIKNLLKQGDLSQYAIAELFNVSRSTILSIHRGVNWHWLN